MTLMVKLSLIVILMVKIVFNYDLDGENHSHLLLFSKDKCTVY